MKLPFFTIGHSNRGFEDFVELLSGAEIGLVADIRKIPRSRANPQFNEATLPDALAAHDISYEHVAALGGLRGKTRTDSPDLNAFWENASFHRYADYALSSEFKAGLDHLVEQGRKHRCVMMCSEAVWWRCHRRIVTDHLIARGEKVFHLMSSNKVEPARLTEGARVQENGVVIYPVENFKG